MILYSINKQVNTRMLVIWNKSDLGVGTVLQEFPLNLDAKILSNYHYRILEWKYKLKIT